MSRNVEDLKEDFLTEYSAKTTIRRYMRKTAGYGIEYLLKHDYTDIYLDVINRYFPNAKAGYALRLLEFGCGAGMNILHLVSVLEGRGIEVQSGWGTDFSAALIESAKLEARETLKPHLIDKVRFCVARTESLINDMVVATGTSRKSLVGSFDLALGVNTIRYCHRLKNEVHCAKEIHALLKDGGVCIVIDMNNKFPAFRSRFRDRMTKSKGSYYLPSLEEYARPFASVGFEILQKDNFSWIPHSAGKSLTTIMRVMSPLLNELSKQNAMRSLVISRKIGGPGSVAKVASG